MDQPAAAPPDDQEADVWWGSYSPRTLLPLLTFEALLTAAAAWPVWYVPPVRWAVYLSWLGLFTLGFYRAVTYTYRLTNRRLLRDRGLRHPAAGEVALTRITGVRVERNFWERLTGVGRVRVEADGLDAPLLLPGVYRPERVATMIRACAARAQGGKGKCA